MTFSGANLDVVQRPVLVVNDLDVVAVSEKQSQRVLVLDLYRSRHKIL